MSTSSTQDIPWVEKYRPQTTKEMVGFEKINVMLRKFLEDFFRLQKELKVFQKQLKMTTDKREQKKLTLKIKSHQSKILKSKARILIGPPGVGKTTTVYALARDYKMSVIELNASDARTEDALNSKLQETVKSTNLLSFTQKKVKNKLILIDEVDGIHGQSDRGGVATLEKIIGYSKYPIIMTCNFRDDNKFKSLYTLASPLIEVPTASPAEIATLLNRISKLENIALTTEQIKTLAQSAHGDYRSAINDLQGIAQGMTGIEEDMLKNLNNKRDSEADVQKFMQNLFLSTSLRSAKAAIDDIIGRDIDFRTIHKWINENLLNYVTKKVDIAFAYDNLALADRLLGIIGRTQDYAHLSYFFDILGGIRYAKSDNLMPKSRVRPPRWFRFRAAPDDEIALTLQKLYRTSLNDIMRTIKPSLALHLKYQKNVARYLAPILNLPEKKILSQFK
ncbi:Replication factor C large subunit [Candidatus Lokiarchaeum ossiferum]|uniref:Replication factor C large subunit n=1 Tax=Candidatus Lokiarchaeum ossiferum TaxID=2951803 RepID=A0ABY6HVZ2_9ARCH|nr:Replication factor C large subunit [Candidatus Lokiarchaeum sp. B-35]